MAHVHIEQGDYRGKHPEDTSEDSRVAETIKKAAKDTRISCKEANRLAIELGVTMEEIGLNADLLEIKVELCQLGLFGYGRTKGTHHVLKPPQQVAPNIEKEIQSALKAGRLHCLDAWNIAQTQGISKKEVCEAADAMGIKTTACQLGVF
jgi:hypothetical protein